MKTLKNATVASVKQRLQTVLPEFLCDATRAELLEYLSLFADDAKWSDVEELVYAECSSYKAMVWTLC
jgi:hypothetical protein